MIEELLSNGCNILNTGRTINTWSRRTLCGIMHTIVTEYFLYDIMNTEYCKFRCLCITASTTSTWFPLT